MNLVQLARFLRYTVKVLEGKDLYFNVDGHIKNEKFGNDYGGYHVFPDVLSANSIVYSIGIGEDISFDLALIRKFHCKVFGFDPTPKSISWICKTKLPKEYKFFPFAVSNYDGNANFYPVSKNRNCVSHTEITLARTKEQDSSGFEAQVHSIGTVMQMLNHDSIDLLKMDIEGGEYKVIQYIAEKRIDIRQICLEFHHKLPNGKVQDTKTAVKTLMKLGFKLFYQDRSGEGSYSFIQSTGGQLSS